VEHIASSVRSEVKHVMKGIRENGKRADIVLPSYFPEVVMFSDLAVLIGLSWACAFHIHGSDWALLSLHGPFPFPLLYNHFPNLTHFSSKDGNVFFQLSFWVNDSL